MGTRENLDTEEFGELLADVGEVPTLYRRYIGPCPNCQSSIEGFRPQRACPACNPGGTGVSPGELFKDYEADTTRVTEGRVAIVGAAIGRQYGGVQAIAGDVTCIFDPTDYPMGQGDRLYFESRVHDHREIVRRGAGTTDLLDKAPAAAIDVIYGPEGEISTDWSLSADGRSVQWTGTGATPAAGTSYTVLYRFYAVWRVPNGTTLHRIRAENGDPFPNRVILRLFHGADPDLPAESPF